MALKEYEDKDGRTYQYDEDHVPAGLKEVKRAKPAANKAAPASENK